jgi:SH3 domain protein
MLRFLIPALLLAALHWAPAAPAQTAAYVTDQLEATLRRRLEEALAQRGSAGELLDAMTAERDALAAERDELERSRDALAEELAQLTAAAAEPLRLRERNRELDQQVEALQAELAGEQIANRELRRNTQRDWFVAGAAVLLLGLVLGVVLPRIRWRRRSRYGEF